MQLDPHSFAAALARERGTVAIADGVLAMPLRRGRAYHYSSDFALVDKEDAPAIRRFCWSNTTKGYARRREGSSGLTILMHRVVMGLERGDERVVDHINGDTLDNRRANLRICTQGENAQNRFGTRGSSRYRGVSLKGDTPRARPWVGQITLNGKNHWVGHFATEEEAAVAVAERRREMMPFTTN